MPRGGWKRNFDENLLGDGVQSRVQLRDPWDMSSVKRLKRECADGIRAYMAPALTAAGVNCANEEEVLKADVHKRVDFDTVLKVSREQREPFYFVQPSAGPIRAFWLPPWLRFVHANAFHVILLSYP